MGGEVYGIDKFNYVIMILTRSILLYLVQSDITIQPHGYQECDVIFNFAAESDVDIGNQSCSKLFIESNVNGVRNLLDMITKELFSG